jgi:hypothetical protein
MNNFMKIFNTDTSFNATIADIINDRVYSDIFYVSIFCNINSLRKNVYNLCVHCTSLSPDINNKKIWCPQI